LEHRVKKRFIHQARADSIARNPGTITKLKKARFVNAFLGWTRQGGV